MGRPVTAKRGTGGLAGWRIPLVRIRRGEGFDFVRRRGWRRRRPGRWRGRRPGAVDLEAAARGPWLVRRLGLDTAAGRAVLGLGWVGWRRRGPVKAAGPPVASLAVTAAGRP